MKATANKLRWDLLPWREIEEIVAVLTRGAEVYGDDDWHSTPDACSTYFAALLRHLVAWRLGRDDEYHLAHAACNVLFLMHHARGDDRGHE
jgi:hypothetical protein